MLSCRYLVTKLIQHLYGLQNGSGQVRLEYENLFALGPLCGIDDPEVVLTACQRCDELGLDTISTGGTIANDAETSFGFVAAGAQDPSAVNIDLLNV